MFKGIFSKKPTTRISLYLAKNRIALCHIKNGQVESLAHESIFSEAQWETVFSSFVQQYQLQNSEASVVLSRDFYQTFDIEKPKVAESELLVSLPFAIKDLVSESIFDLVVDYYDRPLQRQSVKITTICVAKATIIKIRDMVLNEKIKLKNITIEELAITYLLEDSEQANILLSQYNNDLILTVVKNAHPYFSRRLRGLGAKLTTALDSTENTLVDDLSLEIQRVLDYINSQLGITKVEHLYLALTCPDINALVNSLNSYLTLKIVPFGDEGQYDFDNFPAYGPLIAEQTI
jgi:MSHA biogenesis protein MshI